MKRALTAAAMASVGATAHDEGMPARENLTALDPSLGQLTSSCMSDCHHFGSCSVLGAQHLAVRHFALLARQHKYLDQRATSSVALLAYASAGALPHPENAALRRHEDIHGTQGPGQTASSTGLTKSARVVETTQCAVCRLCAHELWLAVLLVRRCGISTQESLKMLSAAPKSLCAHMEAAGMLGHHQVTINTFRPFCDNLVQANEESISELLSRALRSDDASNATSLTLELCSARACVRTSADSELSGWPASLQLLLDGAAEPLMPTLRPGGRASDILEGKSQRRRRKHGEEGDTESRGGHESGGRDGGHGSSDRSDSIDTIQRDSDGDSDTNVCGADGGSGCGSAAAALLLLGAVRSDNLLVKMMCAFGVCSRSTVDDIGGRTSLAAALPDERDNDLLLDALSLSLPTSRLQPFSEVPSPHAQSTHPPPISPEGALPPAASYKGTALSASRRRLRKAAQWRRQLHWVSPPRLAAVHAAAFLLEAETMQLLLHAAPAAAALADGAGRTPLHYVAAGTDRVLGSVYLFTKQEGLRTWLRGRTAGAVDFAPQHTGANLTAALQDAQLATAAELLEAGADAAAADTQGISPFHMAAASGCLALLKRLWCSVGDRKARASMLSAKAFDGRDARALAAAGGHAATLRWLSALWTAGCGPVGGMGPQILRHMEKASDRETAPAVDAESGADTEAEVHATVAMGLNRNKLVVQPDVPVSEGALTDTSPCQPLPVSKAGTDGAVCVSEADTAPFGTPVPGVTGAQPPFTDGPAGEQAVAEGACPRVGEADPDDSNDAECDRDGHLRSIARILPTLLTLERHSTSRSEGVASSLPALNPSSDDEIAGEEHSKRAASASINASDCSFETSRIDLYGSEMSIGAASSAREGDRDCDLPIEHSANLSADSFRRNYVLTGRPLLLRGVTDDWPAIELLQAETFKRNYADVDWQPQYLLRGNATNLRRYLRRAAAKRVRRPLAFNRPLDAAVQSELRAHVRWPTPMAHPRLRAHGHVAPADARGDGSGDVDGRALHAAAGLDFFAGPNRSGIPMHYHGPVWNALVYGRKLWALLPPAKSRFAPEQQHPLDSDWYLAWRLRAKASSVHQRGIDDGERPQWRFCVQEEGDALYVPSGWGHATLNLREGLAVGGFLHDALSLGLHMQVQHAPRGVGSLQNAAVWGDSWHRLCIRAFTMEA